MWWEVRLVPLIIFSFVLWVYIGFMWRQVLVTLCHCLHHLDLNVWWKVFMLTPQKLEGSSHLPLVNQHLVGSVKTSDGWLTALAG